MPKNIVTIQSKTISKERKTQEMVTERLKSGYELIEAKPVDGKGLTYLLAKEHDDSINVLVIKDEKETFKQDWKKSQLISLQIIFEMTKK